MKRSTARSELRATLLDHFDREGRALPWRGETDPYRILVSEIMLQQTRVETVKRYYGAWLERFPDLRALADASEDEVLKAWEGLGYYRRARNLHRAAKVVRDRRDGAIPSDYEALRALPGVGAYTAGAVASIAFGVIAPAVDGNVRRVLARLYDEADPTDAWLRDAATDLVDAARPGDWNQALMELGATICTPRAPACQRCPLEDWCRARAAGTEADRPRRRAQPKVPTRRIVVAVFERRDRVLLTKRPRDGLLGGMWAFPEAQSSGNGSGPIEAMARRHGLTVDGDRPRLLPTVEHRFSHLHAVYEPAVVAVRRAPRIVADPANGPAGRWVTFRGAEALALPVAQRAILESWSSSSTPTDEEPTR